MKKGMRGLWTGLLSLSVLPISEAQVVSDYKTLVTDGGEVRLLRNGQSVMKLRFGLFYDNWQELRAYDVGPNSDGTWTSEGSLGSGLMSIRTAVSVVGNTARLTIKATPNRSLTANSSHINIRFDDTFWPDATFSAGTFHAVFPRRLDQTISSTGKKSNSFVVTHPNGLAMSILFPGTYSYGLQDSRRYAVGYELRAQAESGPWAAHTTKTYVVDLTPNQTMPIGPNQPITIQAGTQWSPVDHKLRVTPGSALDWSTINSPAAGSKGWLKGDANGKVYAEQEPAKKLKFFGTNLSGSVCFLAPAVIDALVDDLSRMGYNMVRLHHVDETLASGSTANSTTLHEFLTNRFHYLIEACRKKGIYVTLDLFSARLTRPNEILPGTVTRDDYKMLLLVDPATRSNWQTFVLNLLNSVSPYTGRKIKDEPAVSMIELVNEHFILMHPKGSLRPEVFTKIEAVTGRPWSVTTNEDARTANQLVSAQYDWMKSMLRANGVKAMLSIQNAGQENAFTEVRNKIDFQDAHMYYAHPYWLGAPWTLPASQPAFPMMKDTRYLGRVSSARIHKKPYIMTEHDGSAPSPYRGEYGLTIAAWAAVQQWDGLLRFGYTDRIQFLENVLPTQYFVTVSDPAALATERAIKAIFHRGDLTVNDSPTLIHVPLATAGIESNAGIPLVEFGSLMKPFAVSPTTGSSTYANTIVDGISARPDGSVVADLFQQSLKINTPATCGVVANPGAVQTAGNLSVLLGSARASVWASSVDGAPLTDSKRILIVHLTEVQNSGTTWSGDERSVITNMGTLPHIARNGTAAVTLTLQNPSTARVYRLDTSGRRIAAVPLVKTLTSVSFNATTRNPSNGQATFYYELVR